LWFVDGARMKFLLLELLYEWNPRPAWYSLNTFFAAVSAKRYHCSELHIHAWLEGRERDENEGDIFDIPSSASLSSQAA
jgi:hypothetical protein